MAEGRRMEINVPSDMEGNYPDSVSSSPRSRETDSDYFAGSANQRWEAVDNSSSTGSSTRVRLMCSCGGKILPRPHDNQLTYVGGDTRILAVDRTIRFATMISKLSAVWGSGVSFKYQLPNEELDSLVSVTNDEDLDNMMAEYDRLQKSGYKSSRLRLFVFNRGADGSTSSLGSVTEESRREQWFVEALNNPPVNQGVSTRSDCGSGSEASAWVNNMPDFLFGLENSNNQGNAGGVEEDRITPRANSFDSENRAQIGANPNQNQNQNPALDQSENSNSAQKGTARISNSAPVQEIQKPIEVAESNPQRPPIPQQVPLQDFQNLQIRHQQQEQQLKQQEHQLKQQGQQIMQQEQQDSMQEPYMNMPGRKIFPDPTRAVNLPTHGQEVYMQQNQGDYYRQPEPQQQPPQQQQQPVTYWQMNDQGAAGNGQYPVYLVPAGSNMNMMQNMTAVRPSPGYYNPSQRVNAAPSVYDAPGLVTTVRATVPRQQQIGGGVSEMAAAASAAEVYRDHQQQQHQGVVPLQAPPVSKVPAMYGAAMQVPVAGDMRMMYRPAPPVNSMPIAHPESYAYPPPPPQQQHVVYDPNLSGGRQVYYTQAVNTQYHQPMGPIASDIGAAVTLAMPSAAVAAAVAPEQQVKMGRVSQATS